MLVFLNFELNYLTPKIGSYIKLKLLESSIEFQNFETLDKKEYLKNIKTTVIL